MGLLHGCARTLAALGLAVLLAGPAHAGTARPHDPFKRAYAGRVTTLTGAVAVGAGLTLMGMGHGLARYDFQGPWYDKARYDQAYLARVGAADPLLWTGVGLGASGVPVLITGVLVEAYGLKKVTRLSTAPGWIGMSLLIVTPTFLALPEVGVYTTIGVGVLGFGLTLAQLGMNARAASRLDDPTWHRLYDRPHRPLVAVLPVPRPDGAGLAVVGAF